MPSYISIPRQQNVFRLLSVESMKAAPYKVIFFDLFNTLVNVSTAPDTAGRYTADILGVGRDEWNRACFGAAHDITGPTQQREVIRTLAHSLDPTIPIEKIDEAATERQRRFDYALRNVEAELLALLGEWRESGLRLGLISNASTDEVAAWPESPLRQLFDTAIFSCHCGLCKPQPEIYLHALERMGVAVDEALFVGDGGSDEHRGAAAVGLDNVLLTRYIADYSADRLARRRESVKWEIAHLRELPGLLATRAEKKKGA
jgi:putative hydrolase of the HAD superfamily